jgi:hypothetical protein
MSREMSSTLRRLDESSYSKREGDRKNKKISRKAPVVVDEMKGKRLMNERKD